MTPHARLPLYEEILLLHLDDDKGTVGTGLHKNAMAGAILAELVMLSAVTLDDDRHASGEATDDAEILALDKALRELGDFDARKASIVELHYFGGLTYAELADVTGIAESTVHQDLRTAKAWLRQRIS